MARSTLDTLHATMRAQEEASIRSELPLSVGEGGGHSQGRPQFFRQREPTDQGGISMDRSDRSISRRPRPDRKPKRTFDGVLRDAANRGKHLGIEIPDQTYIMCKMLSVDKFFIEVEQDGDVYWINKGHVMRCEIGIDV